MHSDQHQQEGAPSLFSRRDTESDETVVGVIGQCIGHHSDKHDDVLTSLLHGEERNDVIRQVFPTETLEKNPADTQLQGKTDKKAEYFTEKELPQLNGTFIQFLEWAKSDEFWSVRKKDERQRAAEIKAEMLKEQKEIIRLIKECEHRAEEELQIALTVLNNIETKL